MKHSKKRSDHQKSQRGQSFVELSLVVVFLMIFVAGIVEFGFMLNNYLNMVDASREAVRYSSNFDPFDENGDLDPQFFIDTGTLTQDVLSPVELDPAMGDDIVISFFSIGDGIYVRFPNPQGWSVLGTQTTKFSDTDIKNRLDSSAPPTGILIVEIFYNYPQVLKLPVFTAFVSDPMPVYVYSVMPLTAAEPIDGGGPSGGGGGGGGATSTPSDTPVPSATPIPSNTPIPTNTPVPTNTPIPTNTPTPTATTFVCDVSGSDFYLGKKDRVYVDITNNTNITLNYSNITLFFNDSGGQKLEKVKNDGSTLWSGSDNNSPFSKSIGGNVDPGETSTLKFYFDDDYSFSGNEVLNLEFEESGCLTLSIK